MLYEAVTFGRTEVGASVVALALFTYRSLYFRVRPFLRGA